MERKLTRAYLKVLEWDPRWHKKGFREGIRRREETYLILFKLKMGLSFKVGSFYRK